MADRRDVQHIGGEEPWEGQFGEETSVENTTAVTVEQFETPETNLSYKRHFLVRVNLKSPMGAASSRKRKITRRFDVTSDFKARGSSS